jgi:hypothetical protein
MNKSSVICLLVVFLFPPSIALAAPINPCAVVAYANGNVYIQAPSYSQTLLFDTTPTVVANCDSANLLTTATIIVANPPQNPPPTAPVYISLYGITSTQVLLMQGTTVITKFDNPTWFPGTSSISPTGVTITSPGTPWVPASITIIWQ